MFNYVLIDLELGEIYIYMWIKTYGFNVLGVFNIYHYQLFWGELQGIKGHQAIYQWFWQNCL